MSKSVLYITSELIGVSLLIYKKVQLEAQRRGIPLICYCGNSIHDENGKITPDSKIYNMIKNNFFMGVIINSGAVGKYSSNQDIERFIRKYKIPVVSLSFPVNGATNIIVNNYDGIYKTMEHLIIKHGYKSIAFVKGPEGHPEAEERFAAYKGALDNHNITVNSSIIAPGDFTETAGEKAVELFLQSSVKIDAIACVDDDSALGVYRKLKSRGIRIPNDIAVTGFDDIDIAANLSPPLTTAKQPYEEMLKKAFDCILNNEKKDLTISAESIKRESCGCINKNIESVDTIDEDKYSGFTEALISSLKDSTFLSTLSETLEKIEDTNNVHDILSYIIKKTEGISEYQSQLHKGRILVNNISSRRYSALQLELENLTTDVNTFLSQVAQVDGLDSLKRLLKSSFPILGIEKAIIVIYEKDNSKSKVFLSHGSNYTSDSTFETDKLIPSGLLDLNRNKNMVVLPLVSGENIFGYGIYSTNIKISGVLSTINTQIAGEIYLLNLQNQRQVEKFNLENRNKSIQDLIAPMLERIKEVSIQSNKEMQQMEEIRRVVEINSSNFNKTIDMVKIISEKIGQVMNSISLINDISENINVLAINTSIQAAHAGDYGKGFTVIAKEIRKLSDSTAHNVETISNSLKDTNSEFKKFTEINKSSNESFNSFTGEINHFIEIFNTIATSMEVLSENSLNIIEMMDN